MNLAKTLALVGAALMAIAAVVATINGLAWLALVLAVGVCAAIAGMFMSRSGRP
ncbi:hypothetical protein [Streptomyces sp. NPDC058330]|uniref:hypothetical protein n=1 Tax=Streptomyces sp. NPDC058330 TaxID=3346449 RepID=UPI0036E495EA